MTENLPREVEGGQRMITRDDIAGIVENYDRMKLRVGMTASHSALDICDGAIEEGFHRGVLQRGARKDLREVLPQRAQRLRSRPTRHGGQGHRNALL